MLLDAQNLFSDNQKITSGTIYSDNIVKFGKNDVSFVPLVIQVVNDFSNLTSLTVKIQTSAEEDFSSCVDLLTCELTKEELFAKKMQILERDAKVLSTKKFNNKYKNIGLDKTNAKRLILEYKSKC